MADLTNQFIVGVSLDTAKLVAQFDALRKEIQRLKADIAAGTSTAFNPKVNAASNGIKQASGEAKVFKTRLDEAVDSLPGGRRSGSGQALSNTNKEIKNINQSLTDTARRVIVWSALSAGVFGAVQALREAYDLTLKVNTAMAELKKVLPAEEDFKGLQSKAFDISIEFGRAPVETLDVLTKFGQAGLTTAQALEATRTAMLAMNVTGADVETTISALIASARVFNVAWGDMANVIDKIQRVQADFSVSPKDLIVAISTLGPAIQVVNGNLDDLFAIIAGMGEAARVSGKEASNALKTIFARIGAEEGITALQELGIAVFETSGEFRPLRTILSELSVELEKTNDLEKQQAALRLGGVRQYSKFLAAIQNYLTVQQALEKSEQSYGDALAANQIVMETYERRLQSLTASNQKQFTEIFQKLEVNSVVLGLAQSLNILLKGLNALPAAFVTLGVAAAATFAAFKVSKFILFPNAAVRQFIDLKTQFKLLRNEAGGLGKSLKDGGNAFEAYVLQAEQSGKKLRNISIGMKTLTFLPVGLVALGLVIDQFSKIDPIVKNSRERLSEFKKSLEDVKFNNIIDADTESKFLAITQTFTKIAELSKGENFSFTDSLKELSKIFTEIDGTSTPEQIEKALARYKEFTNFIKKQSSAPIIEAAVPIQQILTSLNNELAKGFQKGTSDKELSNAFRLLIINALDDAKKEVQNQNLPAFFQGWLPSITSFFNFNAASEVLSITNKVSILKDEMVLLATEAEKADKNFKFDEWAKGASDSAKKFSDNADEINNLLLSTINVQQLLENAAQKAGIPIQVDTNSIEKVVQKGVVDKLVASLKKAAETRIAAEDYQKLAPLLDEIATGAVNAAAATKQFVEQLDEVALASGLKKSNEFIIAGFLEEYNLLTDLGKAIKGVGSDYDVLAEKKKLVKSTLGDLLTNIRQNAKELAILREEINFYERAVKKAPTDLGDNKTAKAENSDILTKINSLVQKQLVLNDTQKNNLKTLKLIGPILAKLVSISEYLADGPERQNKAIENTIKLFKELAADTLALNKLFNDDPIKLFELDDANQKRLLDFQLSAVDLQQRAGELSESTAKAKKEELTSAYLINRADQLRNALLDKISNKIKAQKSLIQDYAKANKEVKDEIAEAAEEINKLGKLRGRDNVLQLELDTIEKKKESALEELEINNKLLNLNRDSLDEARQAIVLNAEQAKIEAVINDIVERRTATYERVREEVDSIKQSITSWLTDQNALFDDLQSKSSIFKILGRGASGIAGAIAQADANIIAEKLTGNIQSFVEKIQGGIETGFSDASVDLAAMLGDSLNNIELPNDLRDSIESAGNAFIAGNMATTIAAWQYVASTYFPELTNAIIAGLNQKGFELTFDDGALEELQKLLNQDFPSVNPDSIIDKYLRALDTAREKKKQTGEKGLSSEGTAEVQGPPAPTTSTEETTKAVKESGKTIVQQTIELKQAMQDQKVTLEQFNKIVSDLFGSVDKKMIPVLYKAFGNGASLNDLSQTLEEQKKLQKQQDTKQFAAALTRTIGNQLSTIVSAGIARDTGASAQTVQFGQDIGTTLTSILSSGNPFAMAGGSFIGGTLAALFGGDDKEDPQLQELVKIEKNTAQLVDRLSPEIINAPTNFTLPTGTGPTGGVTIQNNITVSGGSISASDVDTLTRQLESIYSRSTRSTSIKR